MMGMRYREGAEPRSLISIIKFKSACISTKSIWHLILTKNVNKTIFVRQWRHSLRVNHHLDSVYFVLVPISSRCTNKQPEEIDLLLRRRELTLTDISILFHKQSACFVVHTLWLRMAESRRNKSPVHTHLIGAIQPLQVRSLRGHAWRQMSTEVEIDCRWFSFFRITTFDF